MPKIERYINITKAIIDDLEKFGPSRPKEISKRLLESGWGIPSTDVINKVLTQYLIGQVKQIEGGKWTLTYRSALPNNMNKLNIAKSGSHAKPRILFVCGKNKWRSPTAERIYKSDNRVEVRSAGISEKSKHRISTDDIEWADLILVMESEYKSRLINLFRNLSLPIIENLDIPDIFEYMDEELINIIEKEVECYIQRIVN
jgi:predicted protein tyrosine phosphatase